MDQGSYVVTVIEQQYTNERKAYSDVDKYWINTMTYLSYCSRSNSMPHNYEKLSQNTQDDDTPLTTNSNRFTISKTVFLSFLILMVFNAGLAVANMHYSLQLTRSLQRYQDVDLASLRRIDPFNGEYVAPGECFFCF